MKKFILLFFLGLFVYALNAQDVIYTIIGERDNKPLPIDSVLVENLTNSTKIVFGNLPPLSDYNINLTQGAFWGASGIKKLHANRKFFVQSNIPGTLILSCGEKQPVQTGLSVFNSAGQKIYTRQNLNLTKGQALKIHLSCAGLYIIRLNTTSGMQSFKALGSPSAKTQVVSANLSGQPLPASGLKESKSTADNSFSFRKGDELRFTIYNKRYYAAPKTVEVQASDSLVFVFKGEKGTFTDSRDGRKYKTIHIGKQVWMAQNMAFNAGDTCSWPYGDDEHNVAEHGRLYNWNSAKRYACPGGWHLPTNDEWDTLLVYMGVKRSEVNTVGYIKTDVGKKLKNISGWYGGGNGTDEVGFSAVPGGYRTSGGEYYNLRKAAAWWTASENGETNTPYAWYRSLAFNNTYVYLSSEDKTDGNSVRCVKDNK
jgi:uncharacterized protein (TIGR02145 family)